MSIEWRRWLSLAVLVAICLVVEAVAGLLTSSSVRDWYVTLRRPTWTPAAWLFGPVWTLLYLSMALSAWLVWERRTQANVRVAMAVFGVQLILNLLWSGFFFAMRNPMLAFFEIVLLWTSILVTTISFWRIQTTAGILFLPYLAWVGFASVLNFSIWRMNA